MGTRISEMTNINSVIGKRLLRQVFTWYFMVTFAVTIWHIAADYWDSKAKIKSALIGYEKAFTPGIAAALWDFNMNQMSEILEGLQKFSIVVGSRVTDHEGKEVAARGSPPAKESLESHHIIHRFPIFKGIGSDTKDPPKTIGYAEIYSDNAAVFDDVKQNLYFILLNAIIKTIALWGIFLFFARRTLSIPLNQLTQKAKELSTDPSLHKETGSITAPIESITPVRREDTADELELLAWRFEEMRRRIIDSMNQLRQANATITSMNQTLEYIVAQRTREIAAVLHSLNQGIFQINEQGFILPGFSQFVFELLAVNDDIAGQSIFEVLFLGSNLSEQDIDTVRSTLEICIGEHEVAFRTNVHLLPRKIEKNFGDKTRQLELDWTPVIDEFQNIEKIILAVRDVSELRALELEASHKQTELERIGRILSEPSDKIMPFFTSTRQILDSICQHISQDHLDLTRWRQILRDLHTIKGIARMFALSDLSNAVHKAEDEFHMTKDFVPARRSVYLEQVAQIDHIVSSYLHIATKRLKLATPISDPHAAKGVREFMAFLRQGGFLKQAPSQFDQIIRSLELWGTTKLSGIIKQVAKSATELAKGLHKSNPVVTFRGPDFLLDITYLTSISGALTHLVNNSIDHGFSNDGPHEIIMTSVHSPNGFVTLSYADSGKGLNMHELRKTALAHDLIAVTASDEEVAETIFAEKISTAATVSTVSGRGVGMGAARVMVRNINGDLTLLLEPGHPFQERRKFTFELRLPIIAETPREALSTMLSEAS